MIRMLNGVVKGLALAALLGFVLIACEPSDGQVDSQTGLGEPIIGQDTAALDSYGDSNNSNARTETPADPFANVDLNAEGSSVSSIGDSIDIAETDADVTMIFTVEDETLRLKAVIGAEDIAILDEVNPSLSLDIDKRYQLVLEDAETLSLQNAANEILLDSIEEGVFETDVVVDYLENGTSITFTLTPELADELTSYVMNNSEDMRGSIKVKNIN